MRDRWVASNVYALLTGDPAFSIRLKCGLFKGDDKDVFLDRRDFTGSVPELIDIGLDYILAKINMDCYFQGAYRHDRYELPPDEMRELVINAFAHRLYLQHDAPVFIAIYDSRIEITSPGGLPRATAWANTENCHALPFKAFRLVEFRGAPKTGGYYCKEERHAYPNPHIRTPCGTDGLIETRSEIR